jgi:predicted aspartyl protease
MIRGYFSDERGRRRPFIDAVFQFPTLNNQGLQVPLLVDTGADRTILSPTDALRLSRRFGINLADLPQSAPSTGVGGQATTRTIEAVLTIDSFSASLTLTILEPMPGRLLPIPSLLGRDIISRFALFMEERTDRVLLLEPSEADALHFPS